MIGTCNTIADIFSVLIIKNDVHAHSRYHISQKKNPTHEFEPINKEIGFMTHVPIWRG